MQNSNYIYTRNSFKIFLLNMNFIYHAQKTKILFNFENSIEYYKVQNN